jgi:PAS domain-containing protein
MKSILSSLRSGIIVIDRSFGVLIWNQVAEDLWGLRFDEVKGQSLFNLDIGCPRRNCECRFETAWATNPSRKSSFWTPSTVAGEALSAASP